MSIRQGSPTTAQNIIDLGPYEFNGVVVPHRPIPEAPISGDEGSPIALDGSGSTSVVDLVGYAWDCTDDGSFDAHSDQPTGDSCTYNDDGAFTARLVVTDSGGLTDSVTAAVTVANVAPAITASSDQTATEGINNTFDLGTFTDTGADSPWAVAVDWGDGCADPRSMPPAAVFWMTTRIPTAMMAITP